MAPQKSDRKPVKSLNRRFGGSAEGRHGEAFWIIVVSGLIFVPARRALHNMQAVIFQQTERSQGPTKATKRSS